MTTNSQMPSFEELLDWVEGRLSEQEAARIEAQVAKAEQAELTDLAWLKSFQRLQNDIALDEPPSRVRSNLRAQFAEHFQKGRASKGKEPEGPSLIQRLIGTLTFDSGLQPQPVGLRSSDISSTRQIIFSTEAADVMLNVQQGQREGMTVSGQILPLKAVQVDAFDVQLITDEMAVANTQPDVAGTFVFGNVLPNTYQLFLESEQLSILIGPVKL